MEPGMDPFAGPIRPVLLLPDWHNLLEGVNEPLPGLESFPAMGSTDGDGYAGVSDRQVPEPMDDRTPAKRPSASRLGRQLLELPLGHLRITLIIQ